MPRRPKPADAPAPEAATPIAAAPEPPAPSRPAAPPDPTPAAPPTPPATGTPPARTPAAFAVRADYAAGVTLLEDRKFRQVQLRFTDKPPEDVRALVREAGFQWRAAEGVWSKQLDPAHGWRTRADAERLFDRIADMLRPGPAVG